MKRILSVTGAIALVFIVVMLALQNVGTSSQIDWAKKASLGKPRVAVLLEFGVKDVKSTDWSGHAVITGAVLAHWDGYRVRDEDHQRAGSGKGETTITWQAKTRAPVRAPKGQPAITKLEPVATVGVILHLEDVTDKSTLSVLVNGQKEAVNLQEVRAGKPQPLFNGGAVARLISAAQPVAATKLEEDHPAACYGPDGTLWVAYIAYKDRDESRRIEAPQLKEQPKDFKSLYKPQFAEQLFVKSLKNGKWSNPMAITGPQEDLARCAIAAAGNGEIWVVYSAHRKGNFDLYGRKIVGPGKMEAEERITTNAGAVLTPVMTTDTVGHVWLAAQSWDDKGKASIDVFRRALGEWKSVTKLAGAEGGNCWQPSIAASPNGQVAVAFDVYQRGSYDVMVSLLDWKQETLNATNVAVARTPKFEARPSIVYDPSGRLWIAYEEGPELWGKDYGSLVPNKGNPLYSARSVRVVCVDTDGKLKKPTAELPTSTVMQPKMAGDPLVTNLFERGSRYAYPKIGVDDAGRIWLTYRRNFGSRYSSHPGAYWITFARRLDGQSWSDEIEVAHSDGLLDSRPVMLPMNGGVIILHNTDGRYTTPNDIDNQIYASTLDLPAKATALQLVEHDAGKAQGQLSLALQAENAAVKRMREARIKAGNKSLQYLRGEYHRHTEISWDGAPDGSLEDMFRYAIDAAQMDWIGCGDHDNGGGREYPWYQTQKFNDAYNSKTFTTMHTYERSVAYPHGHRNVMFAQRGVLTLPRLAPPKGEPPPEEGKKKGAWPGGVHPDDAKMLYRYLHEFGGICASHTSATGMGTDWRDHDPVAEPIVEIYQGDRMSYEKEGAPRAGYDPQSGKEPANVAGWFPKGFINLALQKGYKFGFQASSDHWSTHISFFIILAEDRDRKSLLDAVKKRHCYGATDNILLDFRVGDKIMGDALTANAAPKFQIHAVGTGKIAKIDILRDSDVIDTLKPGKDAFTGEWRDKTLLDGTHYYYVRVLQEDGEIAWGSPIWVEKK